MVIQRAISLQAGLLAAGAILAMLAWAPSASATQIKLVFNQTQSGSTTLPLKDAATGNPITGFVTLKTETNGFASSEFAPRDDFKDGHGAVYGYDPEGSSSITGVIDGHFNGIGIKDVLPLNHAAPPGNELLPHSYSALGSRDDPRVSYDNLYYSEAVLVCLKDLEDGKGPQFVGPPAGGHFDIFGLALKLDNGKIADIWSQGGKEGPVYLSKVVAAPEPGFLWLFAPALIGLFAWRRSSKDKQLRRNGAVQAI